MTKITDILRKGYHIINRRLSEQGLSTTVLWMYARGISAVTGIPILKYSQVTNNLYVGPQYKSNGLDHLARRGIRAVVNMRIEFDDAAHGLAPELYCYLPTVDDTAPSDKHIASGIKFITKAIGAGEKVYIHCSAGVGRAPTMAAAYLISQGYSLDEALFLIRQTRPFIYIMPGQLECLARYSKRQDSRRDIL